MLTAKKPNLESLTSINPDGSRYFLHPADVHGKYTLWRRLFGAGLLAVYVLLPWIPVGGHPAIFFNLAELRFHFFGLTFFAEDLWIGFFLLTGLGFGLFYVTALFGRLWCGWACPYTVFLEHVYRRIERFIDGDSLARRKLDTARWNGEKIFKRLLKHGLFILISLLIAHVFISYFVSLPRLYEYMQQSPLNHAKAFGVMVFLTGSLYFSFSWFREQFCIILCPYGRIQSTLTDDDTIVIGYDEGRGEPRGKKSDPGTGDCIACNRCVQVCPTGIDIRNGLQLECIGCANCIDACNQVMDKTGRPRGLIRYDSSRGLAGKRTRFWRPRIALYTALMCLGIAVLGGFLTGLRSAKIELIRMPGQPFYVDDHEVRNQLRLHLATKQSQATRFRISVSDLPDGAVVSGIEDAVILEPGEETMKTVLIRMPVERYTGRFQVTFQARVSPGDFAISDSIEFLGPSAYTLE
ncbi:MAG: cytochrome c oxidase accessory protein CcoG [Verrucomicrobiales bacterium]